MKKFRTSKIIMWLFIAAFLYVIWKGVNYDFSNLTYMDTAIFVACITSVGGILGAIITKYYNNSNAENIPKIQMALFKKSMDLRLKYNEEMMKLKKQYEFTSDDIAEIEGSSHMDDVSESILSEAINELDTRSAQSHEDVTIQ